MKVDIRDASAIGSLRPLEVAAYLRAAAWIPQASAPTLSVWTKGTGDDQFEAVVPLDRTQRDFALRMGELLRTVAVAEGRSQADVYSDLLTTYADVIRIRIDDPELSDGTVPLEAHAHLAQRCGTCCSRPHVPHCSDVPSGINASQPRLSSRFVGCGSARRSGAVMSSR